MLIHSVPSVSLNYHYLTFFRAHQALKAFQLKNLSDSSH